MLQKINILSQQEFSMRNREYRKIYTQHYGEIPKDSQGRSYDIHHIDGDYTNNDISNLVALSIEEHYKLHKEQEDWGAAWSVAKRLKISQQEKSETTRNMNLARAKAGTHWSQVTSKNGTHPFQSLEFQRKMMDKQLSNGTHSAHQSWTCEKCGKTGKHMVNYRRYHGDNCGTMSVSWGRVWVNNGSVSKMISKDELEQLITEGWVAGRGSAELTARRANANGSTGRANPYVRKTTRPYTKKEKK
jgi:hypothetical protein